MKIRKLLGALLSIFGALIFIYFAVGTVFLSAEILYTGKIVIIKVLDQSLIFGDARYQAAFIVLLFGGVFMWLGSLLFKFGRKKMK